ncbi:MAG: bifunctional glycosyl transferase/transpeptidase [Arsenophonus sp.]|nr:MAG: bifunctional glycosyl transferase/transpeptidase [Arsenophonus sp.]
MFKKKYPDLKKENKFFFFLIKIIIILLVLIILYGFYLFKKIQIRFQGDIWDLPAAVYSRIINLEPGISYNKYEIIQLLHAMQYRQVNKILFPGEYTVNNNTIDILRRPFIFPDQKEGSILVRLKFENNILLNITNINNKKELAIFRLEPQLISMIRLNNNEQRLVLPIKNFPNILIKILLETEDRYFYKHDGINLYSIGRAIIANFNARKTIQGGSTLTQQLVKNLFLTNKKTILRKINEIYMAFIIEFLYNKDKILELYLNEVYLGQIGDDQIHGFPLASIYYFGRPITELSIDQYALLIGMVKGASLYNPWKNPELAIKRRNTILKLLKSRNLINELKYKIFIMRSLGVQNKNIHLNPQPAFIQLIKKELINKLGNKKYNLSGAKIFTTLDIISQKSAEKAMKKEIIALKKKYMLSDLEGAIVSVDRLNGEIRAMVGGSKPQYSGFNRALNARRSIGSLIKPSIYLTALNDPENFNLNTIIPDKPISIKTGNKKIWKPKNFDRHFRGKVLLIDALIHSLNVPTVNIGLKIGLNKISHILTCLGIPEQTIKKNPAILLGSLNLTLIETAQMFQTISSGGNFSKLSSLRSILNINNEEIYHSYPSSFRTINAQSAYLTLYGMQEVVRKGTSRLLMKHFSQYNLAGKTGTTNDLKDSWFAGVDEKEVTVIWVGNDKNKPINLTGANGALYIYNQYLKNHTPAILKNIPPSHIIPIQIRNNGDFICKGKSDRIIPIWIKNINVLCNKKIN